ncbi:Eco57I restriction-modification methylase domain-containing protein [Borreliella burgdorferi]|uniref:Eco57I restriction-modification methylase domain-containing protein n=1 Tax=Borreliella burgdorferi TaxID=139 RepID=UPI003A0FD01E
MFPAIGEENKLTNKAKEKQILVILGNPPYNSDSKNNNEYILNLVNDYKKIENKFINEKNLRPLNDDRTKFIRFAEHRIKSSNEGLLGIITNKWIP